MGEEDHYRGSRDDECDGILWERPRCSVGWEITGGQQMSPCERACQAHLTALTQGITGSEGRRSFDHTPGTSLWRREWTGAHREHTVTHWGPLGA